MDKANRTIIKAFEKYVKDFKPCCTSDEVDLDMLKFVLAIVKGEVKLQTKLELLKESFDDYEKHMGLYPEMVVVTENVLQTMANEASVLYAFIPAKTRPTFYGVPVRTVNGNEALFITRNGSAIKYSLDEWREIE